MSRVEATPGLQPQGAISAPRTINRPDYTTLYNTIYYCMTPVTLCQTLVSPEGGSGPSPFEEAL
jgi:hypothetical protein